jgi:hypothetical protein
MRPAITTPTKPMPKPLRTTATVYDARLELDLDIGFVGGNDDYFDVLLTELTSK